MCCSYVLVTSTTTTSATTTTPSDDNRNNHDKKKKPRGIRIKKQLVTSSRRKKLKEEAIQQINPNLRIKVMNPKTISSIISRTKYQIRLLDEGGFSRGESHRKHIKKRFYIISNLQWKDNEDHRIHCDRCNEKIKMGENIVIHKRRSYNRFFHKDCAKLLNLI